MATHAHINKNNKVAISLQYIKKEVSDEIDFLHVDKHESSLQIDTMIFHGDGQTISKLPKPKYQVSKCLYNVSKIKLEMKLFFLHADKPQSFLQVYFKTLGVKVSYKLILYLLMDMIKHSESTKLTSLYCLYNISKKRLETKFIFCIYITLKFLQAGITLTEVARHVQSFQNRNLVKFLQYLKK